MRNLTALLVLLAAAVVSTSVEGGHSRIGIGIGIGMVGARREVEDVKSNWEIQELGRFSVSEFNAKVIKDAHADQHEHLLLNFKEVTEAQTQVVSGIKYYLKIIASKSNHQQQQQPQLYEAAVVVKPWLNHRSLTLVHFRPSPPSSMKIPHASASS